MHYNLCVALPVLQCADTDRGEHIKDENLEPAYTKGDETHIFEGMVKSCILSIFVRPSNNMF